MRRRGEEIEKERKGRERGEKGILKAWLLLSFSHTYTHGTSSNHLPTSASEPTKHPPNMREIYIVRICINKVPNACALTNALRKTLPTCWFVCVARLPSPHLLSPTLSLVLPNTILYPESPTRHTKKCNRRCALRKAYTVRWVSQGGRRGEEGYPDKENKLSRPIRVE